MLRVWNPKLITWSFTISYLHGMMNHQYSSLKPYILNNNVGYFGFDIYNHKHIIFNAWNLKPCYPKNSNLNFCHVKATILFFFETKNTIAWTFNMHPKFSIFDLKLDCSEVQPFDQWGELSHWLIKYILKILDWSWGATSTILWCMETHAKSG